jgi:hypothetical protein
VSNQRHFNNVVAIDFEYEIVGGDFELIDGDPPKVLCFVAHILDRNLRHLHTVRQWRGEFGPTPPFDIGGRRHPRHRLQPMGRNDLFCGVGLEVS